MKRLFLVATLLTLGVMAAVRAQVKPVILVQLDKNACPASAANLNAKCLVARLKLGGSKRSNQIVTAQAARRTVVAFPRSAPNCIRNC
jgi:hypothetical protein